MKQQCVVLSVVLLILFAGCKEQKQGIVGTWTGKGIVGYQGNRQNWDITLTFSEDMTLTLLYEMGDRKYMFNGNYTADLSKNPALLDIRNFGLTKDTSYCCMAIAEFPAINKMNICGIIGQCGEISRPAEFNRNPTDNHQLYHELTKKE